MERKIIVNEDLCIGCGACAACCPEAFEIGDDFVAKAIDDNITENVIIAAENCPTDAIELDLEEKEND